MDKIPFYASNDLQSIASAGYPETARRISLEIEHLKGLVRDLQLQNGDLVHQIRSCEVGKREFGLQVAKATSDEVDDAFCRIPDYMQAEIVDRVMKGV